MADHLVTLFSKRAAEEQGGLLSGKDPTEFSETDPIRLWIVQIGVIVSTATLLSLVLRKIRQPKVIAEVLGGIILGPTAFGRIPGFTEHIFPEESQHYLSLTATIGLCLFLFLVGLEIEGAVIKRNAKLSLTVALAGMALPFGLGAAISVPLYQQFIDPEIEFTHFMLFAGVAFSITAFPVLCRILTELKLLDTTVGIVVLSAGVGNDVVGWVLLALSIALVNAGSGLMALYILLTAVAFCIFLLVPVRMAMRWLAVKTGSIEHGPSVFFMTVTILVVFASAFFTDIIGVHAIFGAFLAGLIVPRDGGLAIALTEKLEDMVSIIFLPLYFTLSGLSTDLGLLNDGITWGYTIAICALAFVGKFGGCTIASRFVAGFDWRESSTIGALMSCKGLIELIVLNIGLQAGILTRKVFSMFVLEALLLTFITTPLVTFLYPPEKRMRVSSTGANFNNVSDAEAPASTQTSEARFKSKFLVVLDRLEHLPGMMALTQLVQPAVESFPSFSTRSSQDEKGKLTPTSLVPRPTIEALRLIELSDRTSAVMRSNANAAEALALTDPLLSIFRMFGQLNGFLMNPALSIVPYDDLAYRIAEHARDTGAELVMLPWLPGVTTGLEEAHTHGGLATPRGAATPRAAAAHINPFDALFKAGGGVPASSASAIHATFVRGVFAQTRVDVALFCDQGHTSGPAHAGADVHLFLPFVGGPDDRLALTFVEQLCETGGGRIRATVVWLKKTEGEQAERVASTEKGEDVHLTVASTAMGAFPDTVYGNATTQTRLQSEAADSIAWARATTVASERNKGGPSTAALERQDFREVATPTPLQTALELAEEEVPAHGRLIVVAGRSRRMAVENHAKEVKEVMERYTHVVVEVRKTVGDVASAFVSAGCGAGVVVMQAANLAVE
ncbi:Sodium/hydrogen exchanger family-domain-containing protein [Schizophyllum amplum]|uniref:Sodium/hydrogen exchanger family-domain-containing protein n=1 Tax=Schizophyllum amplum TaxID=97359 RepID=A0A550C6T0_9AGAR|nr:Sodium/hydrogen exchanger family-domain-containing protein [Auriculariopsis ampla]